MLVELPMSICAIAIRSAVVDGGFGSELARQGLLLPVAAGAPNQPVEDRAVVVARTTGLLALLVHHRQGPQFRPQRVDYRPDHRSYLSMLWELPQQHRASSSGIIPPHRTFRLGC